MSARLLPAGANSARSRQLREVAVRFEALLVQSTLQPVERALGFYGDIVIDDVALTIARDERGGFADEVARLLPGGNDGAVKVGNERS